WADNRQAERALEQSEASADGLDQVVGAQLAPVGRPITVVFELSQVMRNELGDDFGISITAENDAFRLELSFERGIVLDDAIVDDGHDSLAAEMGVSVAIGGRAMRRPAGVANADAAGSRPVAQVKNEVVNAAGLLAQMKARAGQGGEAGTVIAAVF